MLGEEEDRKKGREVREKWGTYRRLGSTSARTGLGNPGERRATLAQSFTLDIFTSQIHPLSETTLSPRPHRLGSRIGNSIPSRTVSAVG